MFKHGLWKKWLRHPYLMYRLRRVLLKEQTVSIQADAWQREIEFIRQEFIKTLDEIVKYGPEEEMFDE